MKLTAMAHTTGNLEAPAEYDTRKLVADLFHQLSQPLTTLSCALELAQLQTPTLEQYGEIVSHALRHAEEVSALTTAIREVFDAGQAGECCEVLDLQKAVEDAVGDLLPVAEAAGIQLCYGPRPACPVWFDAYRLRQGLFHLLGFVVDSSNSGAVVKIQLEERGAEAVLSLKCSSAKIAYGASIARSDHAGSDRAGKNSDRAGKNKDQELRSRIGLGIARAIFEAAGANFTVVRSDEGLGVVVRILRDRAGSGSSNCARPDR